MPASPSQGVDEAVEVWPEVTLARHPSPNLRGDTRRERLQIVEDPERYLAETKEPWPVCRYVPALSQQWEEERLSDQVRDELRKAAQLLRETTEGPDPYADDLIRYLHDLATQGQAEEESQSTLREALERAWLLGWHYRDDMGERTPVDEYTKVAEAHAYAALCEWGEITPPVCSEEAAFFPALRKQIREELEGELLSADSISAVSRVQTATSSPGGFIEIGPTAALEALQAALSSLKERER